jgi:hypothetical protein
LRSTAAAFDLKPDSLAAVTRLIKKQQLATPRHGVYRLLRPEYRVAGAPDFQI